MTAPESATRRFASDTQLQRLVDASLDGDASAREQLIHHACDRLLTLTRRMLHGSSPLRRWEQTDDVFQNAMVRLHRALATCEVRSVRHFFNLAAVQIRRELIDLGRKHFGPQGIGRNHHTDHQPSDDSGGSLHGLQAEPADLAEWTEFHERVQSLPAEEREAVDLLYYEGLSQEEAAAVLGCSVRTVRRRWQDAKLRLHGGLSDGSSQP
jgi:RNA polymerase sigma factor (sigma-70 family)